MDCLDYFALMPVLAEDSLHSDTVFKGYIFTVFMYSLQWYFWSNTAGGKTSRQWKLHQRREHQAGLPPSLSLNTDLLFTQRCILRCPLLTIWLVTFPSTISLHHWPTLHSRACTNLHPWWIPSIHHIELRDITAGFLTEISHNVRIEPPLQPLTGEYLTLGSASKEDGPI